MMTKKKKSINSINPKIFKDYINFFTTSKGIDMLPYVYLESNNLYDNLLKNNEDYYLFNDEVSLIGNNKDKLSKYLENVNDIIEVGPGSSYAVEHKTIPILTSALQLKNYHAIDYSKNYLVDICNIIKERMPSLKINTSESDIMQKYPITLNALINNKKAIMLLGSTLGNFNDFQQSYIVKQLSNLIDCNDIFILTVDMNQDPVSLIKAYSNTHTHQFIKEFLLYFSRINSSFTKYLNSFEIKINWDEFNKLVDIFLIAKENLCFNLPRFGDIKIQYGQEFRGIKSRKPTINRVLSLLEINDFHVLDVLTHSNKMGMFICKKR